MCTQIILGSPTGVHVHRHACICMWSPNVYLSVAVLHVGFRRALWLQTKLSVPVDPRDFFYWHAYLFLLLRIKHRLEVEGKSTSSHAKILAPDDVSIHIYPSVPHYQDTSRVLLLYPTAVRIH